MTALKGKQKVKTAIPESTEPKLTRPALRYFGGKWKVAPWVIGKFPPHDIYIESFGGGGNVLLRKPPAKVEVYNDLDDGMVEYFRVLQNPAQFRRLYKILTTTPYARRVYEVAAAQAQRQSGDVVQRVAALIIRSMMGIHPTCIWRPSGFAARSGHTNQASSWASFARHLIHIRRRLQNVLIESCDALELIKRHDRQGVLHYVDPPYLMSTRSGKGAKYGHEMSVERHEELLDLLLAVDGHVVVSGYASELYERKLAGWARHEKSVRAICAKEGRTEVIWVNGRSKP